AFPPFINAGRPQDLNNIAPRLGFNYALTDKTVIRGGYGIYYGTATGQPPLFTLRYVQQIAMTVNYDGRADFAVNPFNGPAPNYDNRPYPGWVNITSNRSDDAINYHALQTSFTKRMANHWQAAATYTLSRSWQFDQLPLNPACSYPVTIQPGRGAVCDVPITL